MIIIELLHAGLRVRAQVASPRPVGLVGEERVEADHLVEHEGDAGRADEHREPRVDLFSVIIIINITTILVILILPNI